MWVGGGRREAGGWEKSPIGCCREWGQHCTPNAQARYLWESYMGCCRGVGKRLDLLFRDVLRRWLGPREALREGLALGKAQGGSVGADGGGGGGSALATVQPTPQGLRTRTGDPCGCQAHPPLLSRTERGFRWEGVALQSRGCPFQGRGRPAEEKEEGGRGGGDGQYPASSQSPQPMPA